jgi:hypothetical protein
MKTIAKWLVLLLAVSSSVGVATAQVVTATLVGRVTDQSGAVVPRAKITIVNESTGLERTVVTDQSGNYVATSLPAGVYRVTAEMIGFKKSVIPNVVLEVAQTPRVDIALAVGQASDLVEVTGVSPLIKTDTSDIGAVVGNVQLNDIPLNGRKILDLNLLDAGVARISNFRNDPASPRSQNLGLANIVFHGSSSDGNSFLVDGLETKGFQTSHMTYQPTLESVEEFKQQSNQYDATSGFGGGAQINIVTKSGTNAYHGQAYEFLRNDILDARNYFDRSQKQEYRLNQFGGVFGGPIIKDRTFFVFSYEGIRTRQAITQLFSVPSDAQRAGNFSGAATIYDPNTTRPDPAHPGQFIRDPFPGNIIPKIDPIAANILQQLFPRANLPGNSANLIAAPLRTENSDQYSIRVDHRFNGSHAIFGRYTRFTNEKILGPASGFSALPGHFDFVNNPAPNNLAFGYTATISSKIINELRVGWSTWQQVLEETTGRLGTGTDYHKLLGLDPLCSCNGNLALGIPRFSIAGFGFTGGIINSPNNRNDNNYQVVDNFSFVKGNHQMSVGGALRLWREDTAGVHTAIRGSYSFTARYTTLPGATGTGNALADFLLGYPSTTQIGEGINFHQYNRNLFGSYFQDNWHALPNLTLNLGIRWEYFGPWHDPNKQLTFFSFKSAQLVSTQALEQEGLPSSGYTVDKDNFAPRIGLAWRPFGNAKTSVRTGFGMFHLPHQSLYLLFGTNKGPLYQLLTFNADPITPNLTLANAFPPALGTFGTISATAIQPHWKTPYNMQWSLFIQHELIQNMSVEVGYIGNRGVNLEQSPNINTPLPGPGSLNSRRRYPAFGSINESLALGDSYYHGFETNLEKRWSNDLSFKVSYVFSKGISDTDIGNFAFQGGTNVKGNPFTLGKTNKGRTEFDARHRFALSYIYAFPFGRGKRFGSQAPTVVDLILGGWQINGLTTISTGTPVDTSLGFDNAGTGGGGGDDRPNQRCNPNDGPKTPLQWFKTNCFTLGPAGQYGNAGRNVVSAPGILNFDFSFFKNFRLTEKHRLQFRAEFFNGFNHTQFDPPNTVFGTANFGRIFSAGDGRQIQLALKYGF